MGTDSGMGFVQGIFPSSLFNHRMLSFETAGSNCESHDGVVSLDAFHAGLWSAMEVKNSSPRRSSSRPKCKFITGSPADWSPSELVTLKNGLVRYAHERNIMKYVKIAAMLPTRTVRDVALRYWWNNRKERSRRSKPEEFYTYRRAKDTKEKSAALTRGGSILESRAVDPYSLTHQLSQNFRFSSDAVVLDGAMQLLDENFQLLNQIATNVETLQLCGRKSILETLKVQENRELFLCASSNIRTILARMSECPGIMASMPPMPVSIDEEGLQSALQPSRTTGYYGLAGISPLKQEQKY